MRSLDTVWKVTVQYWYESKRYTGNFDSSGLTSKEFFIEADTYSDAGDCALAEIYDNYSDKELYRNVNVEVTSVSKSSMPDNFYVKEY